MAVGRRTLVCLVGRLSSPVQRLQILHPTQRKYDLSSIHSSLAEPFSARTIRLLLYCTLFQMASKCCQWVRRFHIHHVGEWSNKLFGKTVGQEKTTKFS